MTNFEELVVRARKGDAEAQQALYKATVQSVYYTIANLINDSTQAEDLTQDVYVAVLKNLDRLSKPAAFPRWVNRIAANTARNYLKKQKPVLFTTDEQEEEAIGNLPAVGEDFLPEEYAVKQELREELMAAIRSLPEKQRVAIFLHYFEGMTVAELSKALEVGENTVKSRLNAGRTGIGKKLSKAGVTGATATVLGLAFRNDCLASYVPAGTRAGIWLAIESELGIAGAAAGSAAAGTASTAAGTGIASADAAAAGVGTAAGTATAGVVAAKAGIFSTLGVKIAVIVLAAAVVVGGVFGGIHLFSGDKDDPSAGSTDTADSDKPVKDSDSTSKNNPYGLPEEMLSFTPFFEEDDPGDDQLKQLLLRDFGDLADIFEFEDGTRLEYYHDGYAKLYISADMIARTECGKEPRLEVIVNDPAGELVVHTVYVGSNMTSKTDDVLDHICGVDENGNAVYYFKPSAVHTNREPSSMTFMVRENEKVLFTAERETTGLSGKANNPFYPPEPQESAAPLPTLDTFYLDLAAMPYDQTVGWFGTPEFNWDWQLYVYPTGDVCLAFAYGEAAGVNYMMTNLERLLPDMAEPLTAEQMTEIFPGGYEDVDMMTESLCFFWQYKDCPVFIYPDSEGSYIPEATVQYNCADIVMANLPDEPTVKESMYDLIGMSKSQLDAYFGSTGAYDTNGVLCSYTYNTMRGEVVCYMDGMSDDNCISITCRASTLIENMDGPLYVDDLRDMFGDYYDDPHAGNSFYRTVFNGCELVLNMYGGALEGDFFVYYTKLDYAELRMATVAMDQWWTNDGTYEYTMTPALDSVWRTNTEMHLHAIVSDRTYGSDSRTSADNIALYSSDGVTYSAADVVDSRGSVYDLTITFDAYAAYLNWTLKEASDGASEFLESRVVYYRY